MFNSRIYILSPRNYLEVQNKHILQLINLNHPLFYEITHIFKNDFKEVKETKFAN